MKKDALPKYIKYRERSLHIRKAIVQFIRSSEQPVTYAQLAEYLKEDRHSIMNYCLSLSKAGLISEGRPILSTARDRRWIKTFVAGANQEPLRRPHPIHKPLSKQDQPREEIITADDLAWMKKYRDQWEQRYRKRGLEVPVIY